MSSRFGRDSARNSLFAGYDASRTNSTSPGKGYGYTAEPSSSRPNSNPAFGAYPGSASANPYAQSDSNGSASKFRSATPNQRGQYSDAVLNELESQNNSEVEGMSAKVQMLKQLTSAIGDEIRDSTALAEKMNDSFENTRTRLKGTMNRMLQMAERTGVGWRVWLGFFAAVIVLFWYVRFL